MLTGTVMLCNVYKEVESKFEVNALFTFVVSITANALEVQFSLKSAI